MENIIQPNESFNFNQLTLSHPVGIQGGAYFTKIQNNNKPLYIQTPKSLTRQGFVKTGKKYYCDLMFDKNSESLIHWFENLEEKCQQLIYDKSDTWFQTALEMNDVETAFNSVIRVYKSGKYYLVRTNVKNSANVEPSVKIYNEQEFPVSYTEINSETNIISILEIQGIKFTSRNFQIEIELKQIMILNNEPIFESCLIKTLQSTAKVETKETAKVDTESQLESNPKADTKQESQMESNPKAEPTLTENILFKTEDLENDAKEETGFSQSIPENEMKLMNEIDLIDKQSLDESCELKEIQELSPESLETFTLKKPNEVYFKLYKNAKTKAKQAKKSAILAYLEAKQIKKTYLLDNLNDSDSEFDEEIEEVSESELEGL
jgi:hypothetical protein